MKLFSPKEWRIIMWFHYGNCKQEIEALKKNNDELKKGFVPLLSQIQEQKGILDYSLWEKEQEIAKLKKRIEELEDVKKSDKPNESILKSRENEMGEMKISRKTKKK